MRFSGRLQLLTFHPSCKRLFCAYWAFLFCLLLVAEGSGNYVIPTTPLFFFTNFVAGSNTVKPILWDFVDLHCLGAFRVVATVESGCQEFQ